MDIVFRVEGGGDLGWGHLSRCAAVAEALASLGSQMTFVARGPGSRWLARRGFGVRSLSGHPDSESDAARTFDLIHELGADAAVVDLPDRRGLWDEQRRSTLSRLKGNCVRVLMEDNPPPEPLDAELIVNGHAAMGNKTQATGDGGQLRGLQFQPVRSEFRDAVRPGIHQRIGRVLVCLGGGHANGLTGPALACLSRALPPGAEVILAAPGRTTGEIPYAGSKLTLLDDPAELPREAARCDLALAGGGQLKYELACMGLPTIVLPVAPDQAPSCAAWAAAGGLVVSPYDAPALRAALKLLAGKKARNRLARWGLGLVDGQGGQRVAERIAMLCSDKE